MIDYLAPKKVLTPAEYFSKFVNFYGESLGAASGIQTTVDSPTDTTTPGEVPSIYDQGGGRGDREEEARLQSESMLKDPSKGLQFFGKDDVYDDQLRKSYDFSEALGFGGDMVNADNFFGSMVETPYGEKLSFKPSGAMGLGLGLLMGVPVPLGALHALNMQGAAITAGKVKASGFTGGALMEINNAKVYRDPGSFQYNGNTQGMSNAQLKAMEGFQQHGYVGDWNETRNAITTPISGFEGQTGTRSKLTNTYSHKGTVGYIYANVGREAALSSGGDYDPVTGRFGFVGANGWQGAAMGTKQAAQKATRALEAKYGLARDSFSYTNVAAARAEHRRTGERFDTILDRMASVQSSKDYFSKEARQERASEYAEAKAERDRVEAAKAAAFNRASKDPVDTSSGRPGGDGDAGRSDEDGGAYASEQGGFDFDGSVFKYGGRVDMQAGGEAGFAQRPEFVGGNETPTNRQSIADDKPREVPEGTFVINAAAVDFAGREDIEKMVREAYAKAGKSGKVGMAQEVDIAVSEGEVIIPPHIAKIIGYDRLNKINNRGKKEISRRQAEREKKEAAGGGFISRKKFHKGGDVAHVHIYGDTSKAAQSSQSSQKETFDEEMDDLIKRQGEQFGRKSQTPSLNTEGEKLRYRQGIEFGDIEVYADILGKTNFNSLIQAAARDTRTLSDYVTTLRKDEEVATLAGKPLGQYMKNAFRRDKRNTGPNKSAIALKNPSFLLNPDTSNIKGYTAVLAHELMHKGADTLAADPNFKPSEALVKMQKKYSEIPSITDEGGRDAYKQRVSKGDAEHRYIAAVIGQAYLKRDMESLTGTMQKFKKEGIKITDYELEFTTNKDGTVDYDTVAFYRAVDEKDISLERKFAVKKEIQRVYNLYLTDDNRKQFLEENKRMFKEDYGMAVSLDLIEDIPYSALLKSYASINRIMAEDYMTKMFEEAVVNKPVDIPRVEKRPAPKVDLPPEPVYERGFLDKMLGVTPAY